MFDIFTKDNFKLLKIEINLSLLTLVVCLSSAILGSEQCTDGRVITSISTHTEQPHEFIEKKHPNFLDVIYVSTD